MLAHKKLSLAASLEPTHPSIQNARGSRERTAHGVLACFTPHPMHWENETECPCGWVSAAGGWERWVGKVGKYEVNGECAVEHSGGGLRVGAMAVRAGGGCVGKAGVLCVERLSGGR